MILSMYEYRGYPLRLICMGGAPNGAFWSWTVDGGVTALRYTMPPNWIGIGYLR